MTHSDKITHVNYEAVKKISKKELIFASLLLKMRQVLQTLQKADHFAQTMKPHTLKAGPLDPQGEGEKKMSMSVKSDKFERTMIWHVKDEFLYYKQRWYVSPGFLRWELLRQHHNNLWTGYFDLHRTLELLQHHYYWPQMSTEVQEYMDTCHACKLTKWKQHLQYDKLQSLLIPIGPRKD